MSFHHRSNFPEKLMFILNSNAHPDVIAWLPHGRGFIISDKKRLETEILPKYFKVSKFTSFTRRLNRWEFTIHTMGHKKSSYFHPKFMRHEPRLCLEMVPAPQPKKKQSASAIKKDRQKKKETTSDSPKKSEDDSSDIPEIQPNKNFSAKIMPSLPSAERSFNGKADQSNHQLFYSLSQGVQPTGVQFYNPQVGIDPNMMAATMENPYFSQAGFNAFQYPPQQQQFLSVPQQGFFAGQNVLYQGAQQQPQQIHQGPILVPIQQGCMQPAYVNAPYASPLVSAPAVQHNIVGNSNPEGSPSGASQH